MSDIASFQTDLSNYQDNLQQYQNLLSTINDKQSALRDTVDAVAPIALDYAMRKGPGYIGGAVGKLFGKEAGQKAEAAVTRVVSNKGGLVEGLKAEANTVVSENLPSNLQPLANAAISGDVSGLRTAATNLASNVINENVPTDLQPLANAALSGDTSTLTSAASNLVQPVVNQATSAVENLTTQANNLVGQVTGQVSELSTQAGNLVSQASGQVDSLTNQLTNQASDLADQGFRTGRVFGSLQDSATSGWGSDGTLARALNGDRLPPNVRARIGQGQQIYNDLFGNEQTATVPTQPTPDIPEEAISARPAVNYNQPEEFVTPKSAPGASTEMTSFAGDTAEATPAVSDLAAPTAAAALEGDVPTVISSAASGLAAAGGEIGADIGSTVLGTLGGLTEGLLDTPLAPLAIFTGLGAILDKVFEHKTPVFNPSKPEFQSGF